MKKRIPACLFVLLLLLLPAAGAFASLPPSPAEFNANAEAPSFSMTAIGGQVITSQNFGEGKNLLMVYGRVSCYNTQAFLYYLQDGLDMLAANGVTVVVGLHDDPDDELMGDFSDYFGGVPCYKVSNYYDESGMWTGLDAVGAETGSVTFPVVFLRSADGRLRYYSTGYVDDPMSVAAAAVVMSGGNLLKHAAEIRVPEDLTVIDDEVFRGDSFSSVYCSESVSCIGAYAFAENTSLEWIFIPSSVTEIDKTAVSGCSQSLVILGKKGSRAQTFANENGFSFQER